MRHYLLENKGIIPNRILLLENKVDYLLEFPIIKNFNLKDKPISVIEKTLNKVIKLLFINIEIDSKRICMSSSPIESRAIIDNVF